MHIKINIFRGWVETLSVNKLSEIMNKLKDSILLFDDIIVYVELFL